MAVTYALQTEAGYKAGANVSSTATGAGVTLALGIMAEGTINVSTGVDWSSWYTTNGGTYPHVSQLLVDTATSKVAIDIINYDMSGFTNIQEAVARINTLYANYQQNLALLKIEGKRDFIGRFGL
jgi:hypothetical protein